MTHKWNNSKSSKFPSDFGKHDSNQLLFTKPFSKFHTLIQFKRDQATLRILYSNPLSFVVRTQARNYKCLNWNTEGTFWFASRQRENCRASIASPVSFCKDLFQYLYCTDNSMRCDLLRFQTKLFLSNKHIKKTFLQQGFACNPGSSKNVRLCRTDLSHLYRVTHTQ